MIARDLGGRTISRDEVIPLVREVQGRLETHAQVEERRVNFADTGRQRSLELVERGTRLQRGDCVDEVANRLGLHQIHPAVQVRAQRELAWLRQPRASAHRRFDDPAQQDRAAMGADLDDILAGVGVRRGEERQDGPIEGAPERQRSHTAWRTARWSGSVPRSRCGRRRSPPAR